MVVSETIPLGLVFRHNWPTVRLFFASSVLLTALHLLGLSLCLPSFPFTASGVALGIFLGFRTSAAYDRWWEARKLWGRLVNTSRTFARQVLTAAPSHEAAAHVDHEALIWGQIAYVHALRVHLRGETPASDATLQESLRHAGLEIPDGARNVPYALLQLQADRLAALRRDGALDAFGWQQLDVSLTDLLDVQGGSERIRNTPIPRAYTFFARGLVLLYGIALPTALLNELAVVTIFTSPVIATCYLLIDEVGRLIQDPFGSGANTMPLSALCRTIETDLRQRLGAPDVPGPLQPVDGVLR